MSTKSRQARTGERLLAMSGQFEQRRLARPAYQLAVLDAFCGSGPIFPAAQALNLYATGCEKDPASYAISAKRIKDLT